MPARRDARAGLSRIAGELPTRPDGLVQPARAPRAPRLPRPRLLGAFEPLLLNWRTREPLVGRHAAAVASGGILRPVALVEGPVAATWTLSGDRLALKRLRRIAGPMRTPSTRMPWTSGASSAPAETKSRLRRY